eukprot:TRINITY_DN733_c0_g1_i1.p1 TRINITY_DN733_c0_g1~~TRINITY_DN733_c0_g1_i1.p1  ORF type:complete len:121 (+),score=35.55 TRINITY_DN733_c0_g1_i1:189-551(+)
MMRSFLITLVLVLAFVDFAVSQSTCTCNCCMASGICLEKSNSTFTVSDCSDGCNNDACRTKYAICNNQGSTVFSSCLDPISWFNTAQIFIFFFFFACLIVSAVLRSRVRILDMLWAGEYC